MKFWFVGEAICLVFYIYVFSEINYDVTHNFLYSAVVMLVSAVIVYLMFVVKFIRVQSRNQTPVESSIFKQYGPKKNRWYEKYSKSTVAFLLWVATTFLLSSIDQSIELDKRVTTGLSILESKSTTIGRSRAALVVVSEDGKSITCRGYYNHIIEKNLPATVSLIYSKTLIGFERINCQLHLDKE
ncbi:hypothetical protein [Vibrio chagasii]|uniref:hypothetical protein n=1 Tax=Vibrio chagasii TaxID=170679 RepID=UPI003735BB4E